MGGELDGEKATQRGREGGRNSEKNRKPPEVDSPPPHWLPGPPRGLAGIGVCVALCVLAHVGVNTHGCTHGDQSSMPSVFLSISSSSWFIFGERFFPL